MVLDTNVKKFSFKRLLAIILCCVMASSFCYVLSDCLQASQYNSNIFEIDSDFTQSNIFKASFSEEINSCILAGRNRQVAKELKNQQTSIVNDCYEFIKEHPDNGYQKNIKTTFETHTFYTDSFNDYDEEFSKDDIKLEYEKFIDLKTSDDFYDININSDDNYYYSYNYNSNELFTNFSKDKLKDNSIIKNSDYYFTIKNNKIDTNIKNFNPSIEYDLKNNETLYICINSKNENGYYANISQKVEQYSNRNMKLEVALGILSAVIAIGIILLITINSAKGKYSANKLTNLIDKIPFEIHTILSCTLIFYIMYLIFDDWIVYYDFLTILIITALILIVLELSVYYCRFFKEKKNNYLFLTFKKLYNKHKEKVDNKTSLYYKMIYNKPDKAVLKIFIMSVLFLLAIICIIIFNVMIVNIVALLYSVFYLYTLVSFLIDTNKTIKNCNDDDKLKSIQDKVNPSTKIIVDSLLNNSEKTKIAVDKAIKDEKLRTELITNVSHDLKTPLTSIINYVDLLSKCDLSNDETAMEYLQVLQDKSQNLKRLIDDLLEASKASTGNVVLNFQNVNLVELTNQAIGENEKSFDNFNLNLIFKDVNSQPIIYADGQKLYRIMQNLLVNASKYSAKNSRVYINVFQDENYGMFEIKNVSENELDITEDELMQRFVRGDKSRNDGGNGLGLSIAKSLAVAMNGDLKINIDGDLFKVVVKIPLVNNDLNN